MPSGHYDGELHQNHIEISGSVDTYVSLSDLRSMNGHAQSGGHWNAAFRVIAMGSVGLDTSQGSSRSGDGSANGILVSIDCDLITAWRSPFP